jgi:hypothetical protein
VVEEQKADTDVQHVTTKAPTKNVEKPARANDKVAEKPKPQGSPTLKTLTGGEEFPPMNPPAQPVAPNVYQGEGSRQPRRMGGATMRRLPDGTEVLTSPDGTRVVTRPDGTQRVFLPGQKIPRRRLYP